MPAMPSNLIRLPLLSLLLGAPVSAQNLVAHFRLDETQGPVCNDSAAGVNTGQYIGNVQLGQAGARPGTQRSVLLNGVDAGAELPGAPAIANLSSEFTVASWAKLDVASGYQVVLGNFNGWVVGCFGDNLRFTTRGIQDYLLPGAPVGTWFHYAVSFDSNFLATFYVNGAPVGSVQGSAPPNTPSASWFIGSIEGLTEWWNGSLDDVQVYDSVLTPGQVLSLFNLPGSPLGGGLGASYCGPAVPNTSGQSALLTAVGSSAIALNNVRLMASNLPPNQFGFFVTSLTQGFIANPAGSQGNLCLGGVIGRYVGPGFVQNSGPGGMYSLMIDLTRTPSGNMLIAVQPGETRNFQAWFRDFGPGGVPSSNYTQGRAIIFQ